MIMKRRKVVPWSLRTNWNELLLFESFCVGTTLMILLLIAPRMVVIIYIFNSNLLRMVYLLGCWEWRKEHRNWYDDDRAWTTPTWGSWNWCHCLILLCVHIHTGYRLCKSSSIGYCIVLQRLWQCYLSFGLQRCLVILLFVLLVATWWASKNKTSVCVSVTRFHCLYCWNVEYLTTMSLKTFLGI